MAGRPDDRRRARAVRVFRALLWIYPGEFRDEYGREMALVFADRHRAATSAGERALVWIDAIRGLTTQAPKEHAEMLLQDIRHAFRTLRRDRTFALTVLVTLALGIGANTAIFQLIEAVALRNLPVAAPEQLAGVRIAGGNRGFGITTGAYGQLTRPIWFELRRNQQAFSSLFAWNNGRSRVGDLPELRTVSALYVSGDMFGTHIGTTTSNCSPTARPVKCGGVTPTICMTTPLMRSRVDALRSRPPISRIQ